MANQRTSLDIIDVHVHLTRDTEQEKLVFKKPGALDSWFWGSPGKLHPYVDWLGINNIVTLNVMATRNMYKGELRKKGVEDGSDGAEEIRATIRDRVSRFNTWACEAQREDPFIISSIYLDPCFSSTEQMIAELERGVEMGARGVKMHPGLSGYSPDDRKYWPLYDRFQELGLPVTFDTGSEFEGEPCLGEPRLFSDMLGDFPRMKAILAHLWSPYYDQRIALAEKYPNALFDTAGGFSTAIRTARGGVRTAHVADAVRIVRAVGVDRVLYGSDGPSNDPFPQLLQLVALPFEQSELERIFSENARELFNIK